jgi:hypothetical protein
MTETLVRRPSPNGVAINTKAMTPADLGDILAKSGFFADSKDAAQAAVKVMAGAELGFGPVQSMTGIYIVKGKVTVSANMMAAAVKSHPRYDYKVLPGHDDTQCEIEFTDKATGEVNISKYTIEDAKKQGLSGNDNWVKTPRNMLFARAMSNGVKWFAPDVLGGPIYTGADFGLSDEELESEAFSDLPATTPPPPSKWSEAASDAQMELAARRISKMPLGVKGEEFVLEMGTVFDGVPVVCTKMVAALWRRAVEAGAAEDLEAAQAGPVATEAAQ